MHGCRRQGAARAHVVYPVAATYRQRWTCLQGPQLLHASVDRILHCFVPHGCECCDIDAFALRRDQLPPSTHDDKLKLIRASVAPGITRVNDDLEGLNQ